MPRAIVALVIHLTFIRSPWIFPVFVPFLWLSCHTQPIFIEQRAKCANKKPQGSRWQGLSTHEWWLEHGLFGKGGINCDPGRFPLSRLAGQSSYCHLCAHHQGKRVPHYWGRQGVSGWDGRERWMASIGVTYSTRPHTDPQTWGGGAVLCRVFFFYFAIYVFILLFWLPWVFIAAWMLFSSCGQQGLAVHRLLTAVAFLTVAFLQALGAGASVGAARGLRSCAPGALDCTLSSWGTRAELLHGMWTPPGPGSESMSSAFAGGSIPPGKSSVCGLR